MNNIIDINRFLKYEKYKLPETAKHLLFFVGIIAGLYVFALSMIYLNGSKPTGFGSFIGTISVCLILFSPFLFQKPMNRYNSSFDFIIPASTTERYMHYFLKYVVLIPMICILFIYLVNLLVGALAGLGEINMSAFILEASMLPNQILNLIVGQSLFFTGYFLFKKRPALKTFTLLILLGIVMMNIMMLFKEMMPHALYKDFIIQNMFSISPANPYDLSPTSQTVLTIGKYIWRAICPFGLWVFSFLLLREREL